MLERNICYCILELIRGKLYLHARKQFSLISSLLGRILPEEQPFSSVYKWNLPPSPIRDLQTGWPAGRTAICRLQAAPRARLSPSPPRDHTPGCPSTQCRYLHVTLLSRPAAAPPWTPACSGALLNLWGRGGKTGRIWKGWWASSSWVMPCWESEGCRRGQVAPCSSSCRPREGVTNAGEVKTSAHLDFAPHPRPCYFALEHLKSIMQFCDRSCKSGLSSKGWYIIFNLHRGNANIF